MTITTNRKMELEKYIKDSCEQILDIWNNIDDTLPYQIKPLTYQDTLYIIHAKLLPRREFRDILHDISEIENMDLFDKEIQLLFKYEFINKIATKYNTSTSHIEERIKEMHEMNDLKNGTKKEDNEPLEEKKNYYEGISTEYKVIYENFIKEVVEEVDEFFLSFIYLIKDNDYETIMYIVSAYLLPKKDFDKIIEEYDLLPAEEKEKYIEKLKEKYNASKEDIIERIEEVKEINKVIEQQKNNQGIAKQMKIGQGN